MQKKIPPCTKHRHYTDKPFWTTKCLVFSVQYQITKFIKPFFYCNKFKLNINIQLIKNITFIFLIYPWHYKHETFIWFFWICATRYDTSELAQNLLLFCYSDLHENILSSFVYFFQLAYKLCHTYYGNLKFVVLYKSDNNILRYDCPQLPGHCGYVTSCMNPWQRPEFSFKCLATLGISQLLMKLGLRCLLL